MSRERPSTPCRVARERSGRSFVVRSLARDASRAVVFALSIAAGCRENPASVKLTEAESTAALTAISEALGHGECHDEDLERAFRSTRLCPRRGGGARRLCTRRAAVFRSAGKLAGRSGADTDARGGADSCCPRSQLSQAGTGRAAPSPQLSAKSSRKRTKGHRSRKLRRLRRSLSVAEHL